MFGLRRRSKEKQVVYFNAGNQLHAWYKGLVTKTGRGYKKVEVLESWPTAGWSVRPGYNVKIWDTKEVRLIYRQEGLDTQPTELTIAELLGRHGVTNELSILDNRITIDEVMRRERSI